MDSETRKQVGNWAKMVIGAEEVEKFYSLPFDDAGFGYDTYGAQREIVLAAYAVGLTLYRNYFRVESGGIGNIPANGPVILAANRAGPAPFSAFMAFVDMITNTPSPRVLRIATRASIKGLPYVGLMLQRIGQVVDTPRNLELVLKRGEALLLYPEKRSNPIKSLLKKKRVPTFLTPFIELCLRQRAPVVPVGFYSPEHHLPFLGSAKSIASKLKLSLLPIKLNLSLLGLLGALPLPAKFHIRYGIPINFFEEYPPETTEHPNLLKQMAEVVQERVEELIS